MAGKVKLLMITVKEYGEGAWVIGLIIQRVSVKLSGTAFAGLDVCGGLNDVLFDAKSQYFTRSRRILRTKSPHKARSLQSISNDMKRY